MSFFSRSQPSNDASLNLSAADFEARRHPDDPVLDVRTPREFASGHVAGAENVDVQAPDFRAQIEALGQQGVIAPERPVYLYCRSGNRSGIAARMLREMGFAKAYNVGGYDALRAAGTPVSE